MSEKSKKVYQGKIIDVIKSSVSMPDGSKSEIEAVIHPGAALIVPFYENKIVLIRQYRPVLEDYLWELPAGKLDGLEEPVNCARRELEEETGFIGGEMEYLGMIHTTPGFTDEKIYIFSCECSKKGELNLDDDEHIEVHLLEIDDIRRLYLDKKISDAKTLAGLLFAKIL